jgi:hypothetical protein
MIDTAELDTTDQLLIRFLRLLQMPEKNLDIMVKYIAYLLSSNTLMFQVYRMILNYCLGFLGL